MKKIKITSLSVLSMGIICGGLYFILFTATGLSWYLNLTIDDSRGKVTISELRHSFNGLYKINGFRYVSNTIDVSIDQLKVKWDAVSILNDKLNIQDLTGNDMSVTLKTPLHILAQTSQTIFPIPAKISRGKLTGLTLKIEDKHPYNYDTVELEQLFFYHDFFADKILLADVSGSQVSIAGRFGFDSHSVINLTTSTSIKVPGSQKYLYAHGTVVGSIVQVRFLQNVNSPYIQITGLINNPLKEPFLELSANINTANQVSLFLEDIGLNELAGTISGSGTLQTFSLNGELFAEDKYSRNWTATISSTIQENNADFQMHAQQPNTKLITKASIAGTLQLEKSKELLRAITVHGSWDNLSWLLDKNTEIKSRKGNFQFDGTKLEANLQANGLKIPNTGTDFNEVAFTTELAPNQKMKIAGKATTANGNIHLSGNLSKTDEQYQIENLSITGKNFALVKKPQAHIIISPDLSINRHNQSIVSKGTIKIPTANIQLQKLVDTLNQLTALIDKGTHLPHSQYAGTSSNAFNIELGKSVWLHGYGLNANVTGDLSIASTKNHGIIANGILNVLRGNYYKLNKNLALSGGQLKFAHNQLDDPELELHVAANHKVTMKDAVIKGPLQSLYSRNQHGSSLQKSDSRPEVKGRLALN